MSADSTRWLDEQHLTDQQRASVTSESRHLFISAGAGTGKTKTITTKVAYLMAKQNRMAFNKIEDLLAITFTRKAAVELSSRLRKILKENGMPDEAQKVDGAWVSTIHGMCARILRDSALEIGGDPKFSICGDDIVSSLQTQAIDTVLSRASEKYAPLFAEYKVESFEPSDKFSITDIAAKMLTQCMLAINAADHPLEHGPAPKSAAKISEEVIATLEKMRRILQGVVKPTPANSKSIGIIESALSEAESLYASVIDEPNEDVALKIAAHLVDVAICNDIWPMRQKNVKDDARELRDQVWDLGWELQLAVSYPHIFLFEDLAQEIMDEYAKLKRARGEMDNNDLLASLYRAFEKYPSIVEKYANVFKLLLIDEFQDTDQIQMAIAKMLSEGSESNSLVTVGDAQQSIYRFRGADVNLFRAYQGEISEDDQRTMNINFRSHEAVLDYVNTVFGTPRVFGEDGKYMKLEAADFCKQRGKDKLGLEPRVSLLMTTTPVRGASVDLMAEVEALRIAASFKHYRKMGYKPRDMALLLRSLSRVETYADILREIGFEVVISGGTIFWKQYEPFLMHHLLRFMTNPLNNEAAYFVLESSMFGLEADDFARLAAWRESPRGYSCRPSLYTALMDLGGDTAEFDRLNRAKMLLGSLMSSETDQPSSRIRRLVDESGYLEGLNSRSSAGLQKAANFLKALRLVEGIEGDSNSSIATIAWRYTGLMKSEPVHGPGVLMTEDPNAIQVMTIHASKGLEFPIVALGGFDSPVRVEDKFILEDFGFASYLSMRSPKVAENWPSTPKGYVPGGIDIKVVAPIAKRLVPLQNNRLKYHRYLTASLLHEENEEKRRIFYVGATRAQDALIMAIQPHTQDGAIQINSVIREDMAEAFPNGMFPDESGLYSLNDGGVLNYRYQYVEDKTDAKRIIEELHNEILDGEEACLGEDGEIRLPSGHLRDTIVRSLEDADFFEFSYSTLPEYSGKDFDRIATEASRATRKPRRRKLTRFERDIARKKALDLGNALHSCMEYAVLSGKFEDVMDSVCESGKMEQIADQYALDDTERGRLLNALQAWDRSPLSKEVASYSHIRSEVPFYFQFFDADSQQSAGKPAYFTGHIDLMCSQGNDKHALVVDYKTGGEQEDTVSFLERKHRMQAQCYAYAVLLQGASEVDIKFACMEHVDAAGELLTVGYRYSLADIDQLKTQIYATWSVQQEEKNAKMEVKSQASLQQEREVVSIALKCMLEDAATGRFDEVVDYIDHDELTNDEEDLLEQLSEQSELMADLTAYVDPIFVSEASEEVFSMLCWPEKHVVLLSGSDIETITEHYGAFDVIKGWITLRAGETTAEQVLAALGVE